MGKQLMFMPRGIKGSANAVIQSVVLIIIITALVPVAITQINDANLSSGLEAILNTAVVFLGIGAIVVVAKSMGMSRK